MMAPVIQLFKFQKGDGVYKTMNKRPLLAGSQVAAKKPYT